MERAKLWRGPKWEECTDSVRFNPHGQCVMVASARIPTAWDSKQQPLDWQDGDEDGSENDNE